MSGLKVWIMQDFNKQYNFIPGIGKFKVDSENNWSYVDVSTWNITAMSLKFRAQKWYWILISRSIVDINFY